MPDQTSAIPQATAAVWQKVLATVLALVALPAWFFWLRPRSQPAAIAAVCVTVACVVAWEIRKHRRGQQAAQDLYEHVIVALVAGGFVVLWCLGVVPPAAAAALYATGISWGLVRRYRARRQREEAEQARWASCRAVVTLVSASGSQSASPDDGGFPVCARNDGPGDAYKVELAWTTPRGSGAVRLADVLPQHTASVPTTVSPDCSELILTYSTIPGQSHQQHWRFDDKLGLVPAPHPTDGSGAMPDSS